MKRQTKSFIALLAAGALACPQWIGFQKIAQAQVVVGGLLCAVPGRDGNPSLSGVVNTYYPSTTTAAAGSTTISIGTPTGNTATIKKGDLLLVIQMQDAAIDFSNTDSYGDGVSGGGNTTNTAVAPTSPTGASGSTSLNNAGRYEYVVATADATATSVAIQGTNNGGLRYAYTQSSYTTSQGQQTFQVVRVPQYRSAILTSGLSARPWDGSTGGILAIDVANNLDSGSATTVVNLSGTGFRGGGTRQLGGSSSPTSNAGRDYVNLSTNSYHASKGEGIAGTPRYVYDGISSTVTNTGSEGYPGGSFGRGAPGNAGGGGTDSNPNSNDQNSGGGGGGNGGDGGLGGQAWSSQRYLGGFGGVFVPTFDRLVLGGGGGAGTRNNGSGVVSSGGRGGGIAMIRAKSVSGSGTIAANGTMGVEPINDGGGGGGAGGSVNVLTANGSLSGLTIQVNGANGTKANNPQNGSGSHGPGGGGGGGVAVVPSGSGASILKNPGLNGTTQTNATPNTIIDYGATPGQLGKEFYPTLSNIPGASSGTECSTLTIGGTVFYDADGNKIQNGIENVYQDGGLNAILVDSNNIVVNSVAVGSNGSYSFSNVSVNQTYTVRLSTTTATIGQTPPPSVSLPTGWSSTGENLNGIVDNTVDGILSIPIVGSNISGANFGLTYPVSSMVGKVVINEVLYRQITDSIAANDEFIEIYNASNTTIDLSGWKLIDGNLIVNSLDGSGSITGNTSPYIFGSTTFPKSGTTVLAPKQYAVIWVGSNNSNNQAAGATFQAWLGKDARLNDTGDDIWLYDSQTKIVDYVAYGINSGTNQAINTPPPTTLNIWDNTYQASLGGADNGQSISLTANGQDGNASACWEQTTSGNAKTRCTNYLPTRDTDSVTNRVTSVGVSNNGDPSLRLVKRITAIANTNLTNYSIDVTSTPAPANPNDDNAANWPKTGTGVTATTYPAVGTTVGFSDYLKGIVHSSNLPSTPSSLPKPGDTVEYTIYFLSDGLDNTRNVSICDYIPENTTYVAGSLQLSFGGSLVTKTDNNSDTDNAGYYLGSFPNSCGSSTGQTNGAVVVNVGQVNYATGVGTPTTSYGFVRFRVQIK